MGSVYEEITRLETAKIEIETAIEGCGVSVPDTKLISDYAQYIRQIPSAVFSELNIDRVGGDDLYIKSIKQEDGLINATTGGLVSSISSGLVPKIVVAADAIKNQSTEWVLTSTSGAKPQWKKLPVTSITITQGTGIEVSDSGVEITTTGTRTISLAEASSSAIGGVQLGYTASGANIPLQTSSKRGYVALTKAAIVAALGYTPPEFDTNVTQTNTTSNSTYRVLLSGSANDTTETTTAKKSTKLQFNTYTGKMALSGSLQITTSIADHNSPAAQCLVINSTEVPSGTTLSLKNSPGIGFHIANNSWASLIWGPGGFNFINSDASGYANLKAGSGTFSGQIISSVYTGTSPFNVISTTVNTNLNADMVDGYHVATSGDHKPWGMLVSIGDTGVSEMGRYIDYHYDNTTGSDYSTRLQCDGNHGNTVTLPSGTGTLALTSQIPTNTWRSITDSYSGTDSNISLSQKGGNALYNALLNGYASSAGNAETVDDYHIWTGSALEYAGTTHDASTLYFITD